MPRRNGPDSRTKPKTGESGWPAAARAFHLLTRDASWASAEQAELRERALRESAAAPRPPVFKRTAGRGIALRPSPARGEFADVLRARRTWRGFGRRPLPLSDLGTLLQLTFAPMLRGISSTGDEVVFKTSPSAGALHPTEAYVLAVRVAGVPPGLYHFSPATERLHLVRRGATPKKLVSYLCGQWWYQDAAALVIMTSVVSRVWWRYPHPRAYRSILLDGGHLCQTFCLVATWLNLAPFCTQALADSAIERDLGIDGEDEVVFYAAGVGTRPRGGRWVQWPAHDPGHPYTPPRRRR